MPSDDALRRAAISYRLCECGNCVEVDLNAVAAALDERDRTIAELRAALSEAREAMMEPHGEWKDVRENRAVVSIRELLDRGKGGLAGGSGCAG